MAIKFCKINTDRKGCECYVDARYCEDVCRGQHGDDYSKCTH